VPGEEEHMGKDMLRQKKLGKELRGEALMEKLVGIWN